MTFLRRIAMFIEPYSSTGGILALVNEEASLGVAR